MKILIAPDSFKGTLSAKSAAEIMKNAVISIRPDAKTVIIPTADGGEGTVEALGARKIPVRVTSPFIGEYTDAFFGLLGGTAVIESAACIGLPLAGERKNPEITTSFGVGELIKAALERGCNKLILALGGSSTNDLGCGAASALGVKFYRVDGGLEREFIPTGGTLREITRIDPSAVDKRVKAADITVMCDVTNPLYGENGAAYVYAPQKGADNAAVLRLNDGLRHAAEIIKRDLGIDTANIAGGGAAGGFGAGAFAFLGGRLKRGIDAVLDASSFTREAEDCDLILTGEGRFDMQSLSGKAVSGVAARAGAVPCVVIAGSVRGDGITDELLKKVGITAVFPIQREPLLFDEAILHTEEWLFAVTANIVRLFYAGTKI